MSIETDKVILEGWWKKKGGKGHVNKKIHKHRYVILTDRYLDWYEKPGFKRCGSVSLDQIYVRQHPDNITLVVGEFGGKEFKLTSEGQSPAERTKEWYDAIIKEMDNCKKRITSGLTRKTVVEEGFNNAPVNKPEVTVIEEVVQQKSQPQQTPVVQNMISTPQPTMVQVQQSPMAQVQPSVLQTFVQQPTFGTTSVMVNPMMTQTVMSPMGTATTYSPYIRQTTFQPTVPQVTQTTYGPMGTTVTTSGGLIQQCMACRMSFNSMPGQLVRCPYCHYINQMSAPMGVTTTYAPSTFF